MVGRGKKPASLILEVTAEATHYAWCAVVWDKWDAVNESVVQTGVYFYCMCIGVFASMCDYTCMQCPLEASFYFPSAGIKNLYHHARLT